MFFHFGVALGKFPRMSLKSSLWNSEVFFSHRCMLKQKHFTWNYYRITWSWDSCEELWEIIHLGCVMWEVLLLCRYMVGVEERQKFRTWCLSGFKWEIVGVIFQHWNWFCSLTFWHKKGGLTTNGVVCNNPMDYASFFFWSILLQESTENYFTTCFNILTQTPVHRKQRSSSSFASFSVYLEEQCGPYLLPQSTLGKVLSPVREKEILTPWGAEPKAHQWIALFSLTQVTFLLDYHSLHRLRDQSNKGNEGWVIKASTDAYLS